MDTEGIPDFKCEATQPIPMTEIVRNPEHSGYSPDEIAEFYPDLSLADIHAALAYYYEHVDEFRDSMSDAGDEHETPA